MVFGVYEIILYICYMKESVENQFEKEKQEVLSIRIEPDILNLQQRYIIHSLKNNDFFMNTSGTGVGKTIAALAASKYFNMKMIVITKNSGVDSYESTLPGNDCDKIGYDRSNMLVLNYDKFSNTTCTEEYIQKCIDFGAELINLDEVHCIKQNEKTKESERSKVLYELLSKIKYKKLLIQTATPFVNNISETESLIRLGVKDYETKNLSFVGRKLKVYSTLIENSIRFPKKSIKGGDVLVPILYNKLTDKDDFISKAKYDIHNMRVKMEAILPHIEKGTVIYTEYTNGVIEAILSYIPTKFRVGIYSGTQKDKDFENYDVMIITSAASTGTNGMQKYFNKFIFFSLPYTWSSAVQSIGRIDRQGSAFDEVKIMFLIDSGKATSFSDQRVWHKISKKKLESDMVSDGRIEESISNKNRLKEEASKLA